MRHSVVPVVAAAILMTACASKPPAPAPLVAQVSGRFVTGAVRAPVRIVRDRWGVPHVYASNTEDLFVAQGFVQAQDRLFQIDLWRRSVQGRLAEVLGPNFIERDAMTRRAQYRGDLAPEWRSYGEDSERIAIAFVSGINAWVEQARARPPEEFVRAGWKPDFWSAVDLLNRTDLFLASLAAVPIAARQRVDPIVTDALHRIGTAPFFATRSDRSIDSDALSPVRENSVVWKGGMLLVDESPAAFQNPSSRYLVQLSAPGWNVAGVTAPWLPGVSAGHNGSIAWGSEPLVANPPQVLVESANAIVRTSRDAIRVKGRATPFVFETQHTMQGVVIASDRARDRVFTLQWIGMAAGGGDLGALTIERATDASFVRAVRSWPALPRRFVQVNSRGLGTEIPALEPSHVPSAATSTAPAYFAHVLGTTGQLRQRFDLGPMPRPPADSPVRLVLDPKDWDGARAMNAPGQSESPTSPHFSDLAAIWSRGELIPLVFSEDAVRANAESTLELVPRPVKAGRDEE